jgi:hypothetical protein
MPAAAIHWEMKQHENLVDVVIPRRLGLRGAGPWK